MNAQTENPPAFPSDKACDSWQCRKPSDGMSLRDYFAANALPQLVIELGENHKEIASEAYKIADAMLAARQKGAQ